MLGSKGNRFGVVLATFSILVAGLSTGVAAPANAAGPESRCGTGILCGGNGGLGGGDRPTTDPPGQKPPPSGGGSNNGGSSKPPDPFAFTARYPADGECKVRNDGKSALAKDVTYSKRFKEETSVDGKHPGTGWYLYTKIPVAGDKFKYRWARDYVVNRKCLYPSRVYKKTIACPVSFHVEATQTKPRSRVLGTASANTGYKAGSRNYNTCISANANVSLQKEVNEYGFYKVFTHSRVENVTFEIAYTANGVTGAMDKPKGVSSSGIFATGKKQVMTGSLDCKNGWASPGISLPSSSYTAELCKNSSTNGFVCAAPNPLLDISESANGSKMKGFSGSVKMMRDGAPRKITWNQSIKGKGVKVNSYKTQYQRSGTPWDSSMPVNQNLMEISTSAKGKSIWNSAGGTNWLPTNQKSVFVRAYTASNPASKTVLTQNLKWSGTKQIKSVTITSVNGKTGAVTTRSKTVNVPTGGTCSQSLGLEYVRAIGDVQ